MVPLSLSLRKPVTLVQVSGLDTPDSIIQRYHTPCTDILSPLQPSTLLKLLKLSFVCKQIHYLGVHFSEYNIQYHKFFF